MTRKEFIKKFKLAKAHIIGFYDGRKYVERMMYINENGHSFVFYDNDLNVVEDWTDRKGEKHYRLGAGYSWYR